LLYSLFLNIKNNSNLLNKCEILVCLNLEDLINNYLSKDTKYHFNYLINYVKYDWSVSSNENKFILKYIPSLKNNSINQYKIAKPYNYYFVNINNSNDILYKLYHCKYIIQINPPHLNNRLIDYYLLGNNDQC